MLRDCVALLRDWSTIAALDIRDFLDGLLFNVLSGNADAHGKNHSLPTVKATGGSLRCMTWSAHWHGGSRRSLPQ